MAELVCLRSPRLLLGVGTYFILVRTSERLPTWTTGDVCSETIRESSVESMWRVDRVFSYMFEGPEKATRGRGVNESLLKFLEGT
jgi:hypothetical protein